MLINTVVFVIYTRFKAAYKANFQKNKMFLSVYIWNIG